MCIKEFRTRFPDGRIIIVVPTISLLDQWYISLQEDLRVPIDSIAIYSGEEKPKEPKIINLMVINTARRAAPEIAKEFNTFLIVDECHRAGSPVNSLALNGLHQASLGLSATPIRDYDDGFQIYIAPALGNIIYEYSYEDAYKDSVICPFKLINVCIEFL